MKIEKNKQKIAAAANAEEPVEPRPTGRFQPPTDPEAFQIWLNETRAKVIFFSFMLCTVCSRVCRGT